MEKLLSVIVPVFNGEKSIMLAIESVINQPCSENIEIIIINDGSTDNSASICDDISSMYHSVKVIHKKNEGVSIARNVGIKEASGKFIAFLDCDDWWEKNFFDEEIKKKFETNLDCDIFQFAYKHIDYTKRYQKIFNINEAHFVGDSYNSIECDWKPHFTYVYKRDFLYQNELFYPDGIKIAEDMVFIEKCHFLAKSKIIINKICYNYFLNPSSVMHTANRDNCMIEWIKSANHLTLFYQKYGLSYYVNHQKNIGKMLPELCAKKSFFDCKKFFIENDLVGEFNKERDFLPNKFKKNIEAWLKRPRLFWLKSKIFTKPLLIVRRHIYRNSLLLKIASFLRYKLEYGWFKITEK